MDTIVVLVLSCFTALGIFVVWRALRQKRRITDNEVLPNDEKANNDPYQDIEPLQDFDWSTTSPVQIRPFKPIYHLTMGTYGFATTAVSLH